MPTSDHAGLTWRKSSYSNANGGACAEVAEVSAGAAVRDSKVPSGGHLTVSPPAWRAFLTSAAHRMP